VHKHISALEAKNYLRRGFNQSRSLEVSQKYLNECRRQRAQSNAPEIPLLGRIAAGAPVEAIQDDQRLTFADFTGNPNTFALEVRGESMIEDHICSGDYVLAERTTEVRDGDIVVALLDGTEATLKRFFREPDGTIRLQPANSAMQPILISPAAIEIQGRVLAVLRRFK
jgi:repressor LexA